MAEFIHKIEKEWQKPLYCKLACATMVSRWDGNRITQDSWKQAYWDSTGADPILGPGVDWLMDPKKDPTYPGISIVEFGLTIKEVNRRYGTKYHLEVLSDMKYDYYTGYHRRQEEDGKNIDTEDFREDLRDMGYDVYSYVPWFNLKDSNNHEKRILNDDIKSLVSLTPVMVQAKDHTTLLVGYSNNSPLIHDPLEMTSQPIAAGKEVHKRKPDAIMTLRDLGTELGDSYVGISHMSAGLDGIHVS